MNMNCHADFLQSAFLLASQAYTLESASVMRIFTSLRIGL
jgi:hypothetical protein